MKVFVTGHRGYIGAHLVQLLKEAGHLVTGCDIGLFDHCAWGRLTPADREIEKDLRDLDLHDLAGHDCIMHLAAISNDPMGDLDESVTYSINREGSIDLARQAKKAGIPRFLFASSCSVYGKKGSTALDESAELLPLSAYAKSKVEAEKAILQLADTNFTAASLRNATAYGDSPMLRLDLVANNLLACAWSRGDIRIMSDGTPWRPLVHCKDIARTMIAFMEAPAEAVNGKAVNVGSDIDNHQVKDIGCQVQRLIPAANIVFTGEVGHDPRSYRVQFDLLKKVLPNFSMEYSLQSGLEELLTSLKKQDFSATDFESDRFFRLRAIRNRFEQLGATKKTTCP